MDKLRISKSQFQAPTMPAPWIPVLEQSNKGGLGVDELRKNPPVPVRVTSFRSPGIIVDSTLTLYWDGIVVNQYVMSQEQYDTGMVNFDVMPSDILDGTNIEIYYTSVTPEGVNPTVSESYFVRVNTRVPGDPPLNPPDTTNANLREPYNIPNPVTDDHLASGITVRIPNWANMEVGDVLTLTWGRTRIPFGHPLTQEDLFHPLDIHVDQATILANSNMLGLKVFYDIRDIVDNWSLNSLPFITDIEAGPDALTAPKVFVANRPTEIIDLALLGAANLRVDVPSYAGWTERDHVVIYWHGMTAENTSVDETVAFDMTPGDQGWAVAKEIQNPTVTAIAGGHAVVYYEVNALKNGRRSRRQQVTVIGTPPPLAKPCVEEASNGVLDPAGLPTAGATVVVPQYPGMARDDHIYLYWEGTTEAGDATHYSADKRVTSLGFVTFSVPTAANVAPLAGGSVKIYYTVVSGPVSRTSDTLDLEVKRNQPVVTVDGFDIQGNNLVTEGGSFRTSHTLVRFLSGQGHAGVDEQYDPVSQGADPLLFRRPALQVCVRDIGVQTIEIDLLQPCVEVSINVFGATRGLTMLQFVDASHRILDSITPPTGSLPSQTLRFATNGPASIRYLRIFGQQDWTVWDNINLYRLPLNQADAHRNFHFIREKDTKARIFIAPTTPDLDVGNVLKPIVLTQGARIDVGYTGMAADDYIAVHWGDDVTTAQQQGNPATGTVRFTISATDVVKTEGRAVVVYYTVHHPLGPDYSASATFTVPGNVTSVAITQVLDSNNVLIPNGGTTTSTSVTINGTVT